MTESHRLPAAIEARLERNERFWLQVLAEGRPGITSARATEVLDWTRQEAAFVTAHRQDFAAALRADRR